MSWDVGSLEILESAVIIFKCRGSGFCFCKHLINYRPGLPPSSLGQISHYQWAKHPETCWQVYVETMFSSPGHPDPNERTNTLFITVLLNQWLRHIPS